MAAGELTRRVAVAAVGIPLALVLVVLGGWLLGVLLVAVAAASTVELYGLAELRGIRPFRRLGVAAAAYFVLVAAGVRTLAVAAAWLWCGVLAVFLVGGVLGIRRRAGDAAPLASVAVTAVGALYTGGTLSFAVFLRHLPEAGEFGMGERAAAWQGAALLVLPLLVTWLGDTAAYFAGRRWGRRKLIPAVSPGKTWVGAGAGLATAAIATGAYGALVLDRLPVYGMGALAAGAAGLLIAVAAQAGDLVESLFKREAGVKDSGRILPGHGGMLDRLDALFFSIPVAYWLVVAWEAVR